MEKCLLSEDWSSKSISTDATSMSSLVEATTEKIAIFDWDDTLFCTSYMEIHKLSYQDIFKGECSLELSMPFLVKELKELENVIKLFFFIIYSLIFSYLFFSFYYRPLYISLIIFYLLIFVFILFQMLMKSGYKIVW